jgi:uncharacterized protein YjbI with pentapeptide repeats
MLLDGRDVWNRWRTDFPDIRPDLTGADIAGNVYGLPGLVEAVVGVGSIGDLRNFNLADSVLERSNLAGIDLRGCNVSGVQLAGANLSSANLSGLDLRTAVLRQANLQSASLRGADLRGTNLWGAHLLRADLCDADLSMAKLDLANLVEANLEGANLTGASVYGVSAWSVRTDTQTQQRDLVLHSFEGHIKVDDIEVAQFINLLVNHAKLRNVITAVANRAVLILGRFSDPPRKAFLDSLSTALRTRHLLPIIYDFERPPEQDWTETVLTLASLSLFVIADITKPVSVPLELQASVPNCMVPFVPVHKKGERAFSMFKDLQNKYDWVLPVIRYGDEAKLLMAFDEVILAPALKKRRELNERKAKETREVDVDNMLRGGQGDEK